ncbi:unnamed protein product [Owenia fusiformis]|uniref:Uncharacterized protein n=1 Tax=Owenia fusiformis TaxID=6347 RepID=A0A8J1URN4_OWEFU|nr:unnamed protein product [Owenia fusiformis]
MAKLHLTLKLKKNNIKFIGPFPKPENYDTLKDYQIPTSISKNQERLSEFIKYVSSKVNVKNRYIPDELEENKEYIENIVKKVCYDFGKHTPKYEDEPNLIFETNSCARRGSSYEETKILSPNEYDFIPILTWSGDEAVKVEMVGVNCELVDQGYGFINVKYGDLHSRLPDWHFTANPPGVNNPGSSKLNTNFLSVLNLRMKSYLSESNELNFIGEKDHKVDPESPYPLGSLSIHEGYHATSIWFRIGAPICTTDVDLSFAVENMKITQGRRVMVSERRKMECSRCDGSRGESHWTESLIDPGPQADPDTHTLTSNHLHLFLAFKYVNHMMNKILKIKTDSSSYSYKMLLLHHQKGCKNDQVGQCLEEIVSRFFTHESQIVNTCESQSVDTYESQCVDTHESQCVETHESQCEDTHESQCVATHESQCVDTHESQCEDTHETQCEDTHESQCVDTHESQCVATHESQCVDTHESQCVDTHESQSIDTQESQYVDTQDSQYVDTQESQCVDTHESQCVDTHESPCVDTHKSQCVDTHESQCGDTHESQYVDTQESQCVDTHESQCVDTHESPCVDTHESQCVDTHESQCVDTHESQCVDTHESQCVDTHESPCVDTHESQCVDTHESQCVETHESQCVDTHESQCQCVDTHESPCVDTHESQCVDTHESQCVETHESQCEDTHETQCEDTHESQCEDTHESQCVDTHESQCVETHESQCEDTHETQCEDTHESQCEDTHESQCVDTHESQCVDTHESQCVETHESQSVDTSSQCKDTRESESQSEDTHGSKSEDLDTDIYTINTSQYEIPDINYPKRKIILKISIDECTVLLWIMQHVKHTTETSWWDMLLQEDLKADDIKEPDILHSLVDTLKQIDTFHFNRELKIGSVLEVEWLHKDNTKTVFRFIKEVDSGSDPDLTAIMDSLPDLTSDMFTLPDVSPIIDSIDHLMAKLDSIPDLFLDGNFDSE